MAVRPIIEIDVQDEKFRRFYELFEQYSSEVEAQPETWRKLSAAMGEATAGLEDGALSGKEALALAAAQATIISEAISEAASSSERLESGTKRSNTAMDKLRKGAEGVGSAVKSIVGGVLKFAEFAGLGGLLGGFGVAGLAGSAFNRFRTAGGLGLTPGQLSSFQVNAQQFLDVSDLQNAANAQIDISKAGQLAVLGIDYRRAQTMDTRDLAFAELKSARRAYLAAQKRGLPPMQSPTVMSYLALGGNLNELRFAAGQSEADINAAQSATRRDTAALGFDRETAREWARFKIDLDKAGVSIETSLIRGLAPLAPQLTELTKAVADLITGALGNKTLKQGIDETAIGIEKLAHFMENVNWLEFGKDVSLFGSYINAALRLLGILPKAKPGPDLSGGSVDRSRDGSWLTPFSPDWDQKKDAWWNAHLGGSFKATGADMLNKLRILFDGPATAVGDAWHFLTSPIAGPAAAAVIGVAGEKKVDPLLALATAMQESGLNPRSVGDQGHSHGLFQLEDTGEGAGLTTEQAFDPTKNARVAISVMAQKLGLTSAAALNEFSRNVHSQYEYHLKHHQAAYLPSHTELAALAKTPGLYAAIAQRPDDPFGYAKMVNDRYKALHDELPAASAHKSLERTIKKAMQKRTQKPATVSISNSTAARVAVSLNAASLG